MTASWKVLETQLLLSLFLSVHNSLVLYVAVEGGNWNPSVFAALTLNKPWKVSQVYVPCWEFRTPNLEIAHQISLSYTPLLNAGQMEYQTWLGFTTNWIATSFSLVFSVMEHWQASLALIHFSDLYLALASVNSQACSMVWKPRNFYLLSVTCMKESILV